MDSALTQTLALLYGLAVGASLGLTGGGGSIFAVPLLIYGLGVPARVAIDLSLAAVGITAGFGAALRLRHRDVDLVPGLVFAVGGMAFAPVGGWFGGFIAPAVLLSVFAILMIYIGWRTWRGKTEAEGEPGPCVLGPGARLGPGCYSRLICAGAAAGLLSGLFGVGGGFIIVPGLLYVTGTSIHRAIATSLLVIFLISAAAVATSIIRGQAFPMPLSALFVGGGFAGMFLGSAARVRLNGPALRKVFAVAMWLVGLYLLVRNAT